MSNKDNNSVFANRVLNDMSSAVLVLDARGKVVYVNAPAEKLLEISTDDNEKESFLKKLRGNKYNDSFSDYVIKAVFEKETTHKSVIEYEAPSGKRYVFHMSSSYLGESHEEALVVITLDDETEKAELKRKLTDSSKTFYIFLVFFCSWIIIYALWAHLNKPVGGPAMTVGVEILSGLMLVYMLKCTSLTGRDLGIGISKKELFKTLKVAGIVAACAVVFLIILKAVARIINPQSFGYGSPFIDFSRFGINQLIYIITAGVQEFLARSVMQSNLERIIVGKNNSIQAIIVSSLIFAAIHVHLGFYFMIGAAILAGLEGILYYKQKNIYGVWLVHWTFGVSGTLLCLIDH
ncbi:MAG: CPBP family intramembrane metalloprotease [Clostridiales bacterium]|nr:CPBP family intramembrane metalloprotease [Clostridiales bacterium]